MKTVVERVIAEANHKGSPDATLEIVDISSDAQLDARYGLEIPVLMIDGKKAAKYRVNEGDLERRLRAALGSRSRP